MHHVMIALHKKLGKLVRTGPKEVSVSDLFAIGIIYGPDTKSRKSSWYRVWPSHRKFDLQDSLNVISVFTRGIHR